MKIDKEAYSDGVIELEFSLVLQKDINFEEFTIMMYNIDGVQDITW